MVDNLFRRFFRYALPVVAFAGIGVYTASTANAEYVASGTLSASSNPLVAQTEVRGGSISIYESPASGTARLINEQLQTDAFLDDVLARAGLTQALDAGLISRDIVRQQISAFDKGENFLGVNAVWNDGQSAYLLVDATINGYLDYVDSIVSGDSVAAIAYWQDRQTEALKDQAAAEQALDDYLAEHPGLSTGTTASTEEELTVVRLDSAVDRALNDVAEAQEGIRIAERAVDDIRSDAGRSVRVVDSPTVPLEPESGVLKQILTVAMFTVLGLLVAIAALLLATIADRSVRSREQLNRITGAEVAVTVPVVKSLTPKRRLRSVKTAKAA
jgi:uncharacterized protein involved in exopolysaccharide biosynthesis